MPTNPPAPDRGWLDTLDGVRLYREDRLAPSPKAALLFVHGFAGHGGRYAALADRFVAQGYSAFLFDYRGHGRSDGRRGHVFAFEEYLHDLRAFRQHVSALTPDLPRFVLGHSNGGLIALHGLSRDPEGIDGLVLSSPFFGFSVKVPWIKKALAKRLSRHVPAFALPTALDASTVSHDPETVQRYATDPLIGRVASSRWYTETVAAHQTAPAAARRLKLPTLVQQAGDDRIASALASRSIFEVLGSADRTWREYPSLFHEVWFERDREPVLADLEAWLTDHLPESA